MPAARDTFEIAEWERLRAVPTAWMVARRSSGSGTCLASLRDRPKSMAAARWREELRWCSCERRHKGRGLRVRLPLRVHETTAAHLGPLA